MPFKIFYTLFLVVCFLYPFEYVFGPVALRHILAFALIPWIVSDKRIKFDWVVWMYVVYLFFMTIASIATGYLTKFIPTLVGTHITCIIMYMSTKKMMADNGGSWILYTLISIAVIDAIVTIAQFLNLSLARTIANVMRVSLIDEADWEQYETYGGAVGGLVAGGLLRGVKNGYFLCAAVVLSLIHKSEHIKVQNIILCVFFVVALFVTQERAAFYLGILSLVLYIIIGTRSQRNRNRIVLYVFSIIALALYADVASSIDMSETRYAMLGSESDGREIFWRKAFDYVAMNPLGGAYDFYAKGGYLPHNFIPNSYINGGVFGGTVVVALVIIQIYICLKLLLETFKRKHSMTIAVLALIYLAYTGNSCFHNLSLSMGDEVAFLWWAILSSLLTQEKQEEKKMIKQKVALV